MPDNKNPSIENNNNIETPKKRSFFWWNLDLEKKDFLDFRYNTQEEIDKLNNEMMIEDLNSTVTQSNNIENQINTKDDELVEESEIEGSADSSLENMQWGIQSPEEEINTEEELMEDDTDNISNKNNEEIVNAELEPESIDEESNLQVNDNQDLEYNEIFEWTDDENDWISSNKIFDPFELNFDDEDENDIENESIESNNENENNSENNDEDNNENYGETVDENYGETVDENYGETVDENSIEGNNEDETENNDEIKNDNENKIMDNDKDEIVDNDEDELSKGNDDVEGNTEDEIIDNNENTTESTDENTTENNQDFESLDEIKNNDSFEDNISEDAEDAEDSNDKIVENIEGKDIIENHDEDNIDSNDENEAEIKNEDEPEYSDEPEYNGKDKVVNDNEDEVVDDDEENDAENDDEDGILDEEDDKIEEDNTESDIIENNEDNKISDDEYDNGIWVNTPFIPAGNGESNQTEKANDTVRKKKRYSREWKQITKEEIELEEWQDIADNENDEEYIPSDEEIFEQEPEFFADDELSKQFMKLVRNARWIFKLERKNGEAESCFKIIGWKNTDTTIEYLFYLIEQPSEPLDLFIKKIERDLANWEEVEHLVQFSYADKKLNIFVDEVILYEDINNADDSSWEYRDTKAILEKFIFLTQTHYDELESEVKRQQEEKQKKRQLQNIFKGF